MSDVFTVVCERLLAEHPKDEEGRMLHSPGLKTGGKFYAFASSDDVILKLPAARVAQLIEDGVGEPCSPRPGSPMREWVSLPSPHEQQCEDLVREARTFVASLR